MDRPCTPDTITESFSGTTKRRRSTILHDISLVDFDQRSPEDSLSPAEVAKQYGVTVGTLRNWRTQGIGPAYSKPSRRVVYKRRDVDAYEVARRVEPKGRGT